MRRNNCGTFVYVLIIVTLYFFSSCQWLPEVESVRLSESAVTMQVGSARQLSATVEPAAAEYDGIGWSSNNPSVVSVSNGTLVAHNVGSASITATAAGVTSSPCEVTVRFIPVNYVTLDKTSLSIIEGESTALVATISPSNATDKSLSWSSSNPSVARVDAYGTVIAVSPGTATITVRAHSNVYATCQVTVKSRTISVTGVSLNRSSLTINKGETSNLTATVSPSNATNKDVTWTSNNSDVASVASDGTITANKVGSATITVKTADGGKTATCSITVKSVPVTSVTLSPSSLSMTVGETTWLTATVSPSNASNKDVTWTSSNTSVATVSSDGEVTAKKVGTATITAKTTDGGKTATCSVTVKASTVSVTGVSLNTSSLTLQVGKTASLVATVSPSNATNKEVIWTVGNTSVASVTSSGLVTAKKVGTTVVTVKTSDGGKTATCTVTVKSSTVSVTGVAISPSSLSLTAGDTYELTPTVSPSNATNKAVTWSSSNTSVATVSSDGTVTAKSAGSATITCTTSDGGKTATCSVTVKAGTVSVTGVSLNRTSMSLTAGTTGTLTATVSPSNATNKAVTWSSNNTTVATVSSSGVVTAKAAGSATITVRTDDGGRTATCTVSVTAATISVTGVSLNRSTMSLVAGSTGNLTATVSPSNATNTGVSWSSSNTSVATVSNSGVVTAKEAGTASITVTTSDGSKTASCTVTVTNATVAVTGVSISPTSLSLNPGQTSKLTPTVSPSNATNTAVSWSSSNTSVATVASDGTVAAKAAGSATITCTTQDGSKKATCSVTVSAPNVTLTFVPQAFINGMNGFAAGSVVLQPLGATYLDSSSEMWSKSGSESVSTDPAIIQYQVSPSNSNFDYTDEYSVSYKDVTRTVSSSDFSMFASFVSYIDGILSLKMDINGREAYENHMTQFALHVRKGGVTYSSDFATLRTERCRPILAGITPLSAFWSNSIDPSSCDATVSYTNTLDLRKITQVQMYNEETDNSSVITASGMEERGLSLEYELVKNYMIGSPVEDQANYVELSDGYILRTRYSGNIPSGYRTPIVRIKLMHGSNVVDVTYKKICISFPSAVSVTGVSLDKTSLSLEEGNTATLTATVSPSNATNKAVTWSSSNTSVATVSTSGVVTAKSAGSATITCTTEDGAKKATCAVTVSPATVSVTGVSLDNTSLSLEEGKTATLTATVSPSNATNKAVTWSSSNTSVAIVSTSGVVTAKSVGSATITCTTEDSAKKATCAVTVTGATTGTENGHEWVDLGLPSGIKWAKTNVGSSSSYYAGEYYAWGETSVKNTYEESNYKWLKYVSPNVYSLTKYCTNSSYGTKDGKTTLESSDDIASREWGGKWRMPTKENFEELLSYCTWSLQTSGTKGYKVTSKVNGNSIFLPVCGSWSSSLVYDTSLGNYWTSSTPGNKNAYMFEFNLYTTRKINTCYRTYGLNVRPVIM